MALWLIETQERTKLEFEKRKGSDLSNAIGIYEFASRIMNPKKSKESEQIN